MSLATPWYSKASPRVLDHNPILHSSFYDQSVRREPRMVTYGPILSPHSPLGSKFPTPRSLSPGKPAALRSSLGRSAAIQLDQAAFNLLNGERLYKTRPRSLFRDTITGAAEYHRPPEITSLNPGLYKPNIALVRPEKIFERF